MAKPKGGNLAALWEVSDQERQQFFEHIQKRSLTGPEMTGAAKGDKVSSPDKLSSQDNLAAPDKLSSIDNLTPPDKLPPSVALEPRALIVKPHEENVVVDTPDNLSSPDSLAASDNLSPPDKLSSTIVLLVDTAGNVVEAKYTKPRTRVQDAHTGSEHLVYTTLWAEAGKIDPRRDYRDAAIEIRRIAANTGISPRNVTRILRSLEDKLSIRTLEPESSRDRIGRKYRVFSMGRVLENCKNAGFEYVYRYKNAVDLARPFQSSPDGLVPETINRPPDNLASPDSLSPLAPDKLSPAPPDKLSSKPPDKLSPHSGIKKRKEESGTTTTTEAETSCHPLTSCHPSGDPAVEQLAAQLASWIAIDDEAVQTIWTKCREGDSTCTPDEVAYMAAQKKPLLQNREHEFRNPVGLLISSVPKFFANGGGEVLKQHRKDVQRRREETEHREEERRELARRILANPGSDETDTEWARQELSAVTG
jgi:hypothetical protein